MDPTGQGPRPPLSGEIAPYIQHTMIASGVTHDDVIRHAQEAIRYGFDAVMIPGSRVELGAEVLAGSGIEVASTLDFPTTGIMTSRGRTAEACELARLGATQIDIGVQIGWLKDGNYRAFREDIACLVDEAGVPIKAMLELPLLTPEEREAAVELSVDAGVAFLKNASSGTIGKATPELVRFLVDRAPSHVRVKASGGIATYAHALSLIEAGAALIGSSASIAIVTGTHEGTLPSY